MHINCCQLWATVFVTGVGGVGIIVQELKGGRSLHLAARRVFIRRTFNRVGGLVGIEADVMGTENERRGAWQGRSRNRFWILNSLGGTILILGHRQSYS